ncbi:MAG: hypothetical protein GOP50_00745 [Candidatus Heimdallarchaeota archaeon]|nr:hypothetical protein [Candidatus Heimdallarchaeota archaeon]
MEEVLFRRSKNYEIIPLKKDEQMVAETVLETKFEDTLRSSTLLDILNDIIKEEGKNYQKLLSITTKDIDVLQKQKLEIIPVSHHSLASAIQTRMRLAEKKPKIIFLEASEDFQKLLPDLKHCTLPVAFQGFVRKSNTIKPDRLPIACYAVNTEASAEYQAIKYASENANTEVVFVDASCEQRILWQLKFKDTKVEETQEAELGLSSENQIHLNTADLLPSREEFVDLLISKAGVSHFSEWWLDIVENTLLDTSYENFRQIMTLIGSVFRRLGSEDNVESITKHRDSFMWNKIKDVLSRKKVQPDDCIFICGASHAIKMVEEWGMNGKTSKNKVVDTSNWKYGLVQSDFLSVDAQFGQLPGVTGEIDARWNAIKSKMYLVKPQDPSKLLEKYSISQHDQLVRWAIDVVKRARKEGYLTSPADSIEIVRTTYRFKELRNRPYISKLDFIEAATTCIEKDDPYLPKIEDLIGKILFINKMGKVGYHALPPLAQDVMDRLAFLKVPQKYTRIKRILYDLRKEPQYQPISELLWLLKFLEVNVTPIVGQKKLGIQDNQESWDLYLFKQQNPLIRLAYEGISVEEVFRNRVVKTITKKSKPVEILKSIHTILTYLDNNDLSLNYLNKMLLDSTFDLRFENPMELYNLTIEILNFYRTQKTGVPQWFNNYILTAYRAYCQELASAADDSTISTESIATIFNFIFKVESIALAQGASRNELELAFILINRLKLPLGKKAVVLAAESLLNHEKEKELKMMVAKTFWNPLTIQTLSDLLAGVVYATNFAPNAVNIIIELLDQCFRKLDNNLLFQWLPLLIDNFSELNREYIKQIEVVVKRYYKGSTTEIEKMDLWYDEDYYDSVAGKTKAAKAQQAAISKPVTSIEPTTELGSFLQENPSTVSQLAILAGIQQGWDTIVEQELEIEDVEQPKIEIQEVNYLGKLINQYSESVNAIKNLQNVDLEFVGSEITKQTDVRKTDVRKTEVKKEDEGGVSAILNEYDDTLKEIKKLGEEIE